MAFFFFIMAALFGAALGSFASVLIARSATPRRIIWQSMQEKQAARSACPNCGRALTALDLLPLFGWLLAGGHCRSCKQPIGLNYLIYELAGAAIIGWAYRLSAALPDTHFVMMGTGFLTPFLIAIIALLLQRRAVPVIYWGGAVSGLLITLFAAM